MRLILCIILLIPALTWGANMTMWPWGLRFGNGSNADRANVQYTGKARAIPDAMQYGGELEFDGVGTYVEFPTISNALGSDLSIGITFKHDVTTSQALLGHSSYGAMLVRLNTDTSINVSLNNDGSSSNIFTVPSLGTDNHKIIVTATGGIVSLYLDGSLISSASGTHRLLFNGIGQKGDSYFFNGQIGNVQIWNHAFTQSDVEYDFDNQSTTADTRTGTDLTRANLKGHWKLDEQWGTVAEDSSDYGNDGTLVGFGDREYPRLRDTGKSPKDNAVLHSGQMLDFDGVDDDIVITGVALGEGTQFTRAFTVQTSDTQWRSAYFIDSDYGKRFYVGAEVVGIGAGYAFHGINELHDGDTHRIVVIRDGGTGYLYIDGVLKITLNSIGTATWSSVDLCFASKENLNYFLNGFLGNVQIWNAALTPDDVAFDYANPELPAYNRPGTSLTRANLKGWWPLIAGSGDCAYDYSDNGNHGIINVGTEGNTSVQTAWDNAKALSDPRVCQTALMEWGRGSNLLPNNSILTDWAGSSNVGVTAEVGIDGAFKAWELSDNEPTTEYLGSPVIPITANTNTYTYTCFIKKDSNNTVFPCLRVNIASTDYYIRINTSTGAVSAVTGAPDNYFTVDYDDWWLVVINQANDGADTSGNMLVYPAYGTDWNGYGDTDATRSVIICYPSLVNGSYLGATTITHANPATNALTPIRDWESQGQFTREYDALNFNGRSFADAGNGPDVNPTSAVIIEVVVNLKSQPNSGYIFRKTNAYRLRVDAASTTLKYLIYLEGGESQGITLASLGESRVHLVLIYDSISKYVRAYLNGVFYDENIFSIGSSGFTIKQNSENLGISAEGLGLYPSKSQLPLFRMITDEDAQKIIDKDLDAWVARRYLKAKAKYNLP